MATVGASGAATKRQRHGPLMAKQRGRTADTDDMTGDALKLAKEHRPGKLDDVP